MERCWNEIKETLTSLGCSDATMLNPGATAAELDELEIHLGVVLPAELKEFLSIHNGQGDDGAGLVFAEQLLSTYDIRRCWDDWRNIDEEEMNEDCASFMESAPEGYIKPMYTNKRWIPLTHDGGGNHIGIDYDPDENGSPGQIIAFGRDEDTKRLIAPDFETFLSKLSVCLKQAEWTGEYIEGQLL